MALLCTSEVLTLNPFIMGFPRHSGLSNFERDTLEIHECYGLRFPRDDYTRRRCKLSVSVEKLTSKMKDEPRSILKKSISADEAKIHELKQCLLSQISNARSLPDIDQITNENTSEPPKSPTKNVTFADDNNLSLVEIRNFIPSSDNINEWQSFRGKYKVNLCETEESNMLAYQNKKNNRKKPNELTLCFKEPSECADFLERFKHRCVALEKCGTRDRVVTGVIMVKNMEYHKSVFVRYTLDSWQSSADTEACYVPNSNDGGTDRFTFSLSLPKSSKEMEFAICYKISANEFWDNNYNRNYKIQDILATAKN